MTPRLLIGLPDPQAPRHGIGPRCPLPFATGAAVALAAMIGLIEARITNQQAGQSGPNVKGTRCV